MTAPSLEAAAELAEDARQLLADIERSVPGSGTLTTECRPPIDVFETPASIEVVVDLPGVSAEAVRVLIRRTTLLIVGAKVPAPARRESRFHVAERSYGQFARAVRLPGTFDAARAQATAASGQIRVTLPKVEDRRGQAFHIPVKPA